MAKLRPRRGRRTEPVRATECTELLTTWVLIWLDGLDHAHRVDCRPPIAEVVEDHVCADGKCKTDQP